MSEIKRAIKLRNGKTFELSKVTEIKATDTEFIYFDRLSDGTWRVCYTKGTINEVANLEGLEIERAG